MKDPKIMFFILMTVGLMGCSQSFNHDKELKFSGTLELTEHSLGTKVAGRIVSLAVDEGDEVKKGQLIATLDRFDQAQKDYERTEELLKEGGVTQQSLEYSALSLDDQQVVAPIDGVVLVKVHEVGETVAAGSAVVVIGDRSKLWVRIYVPEGEINRIQMNQSATLTFDGLKESFPGHISFISPQAEFTPRNVQTQEERITQTFAVKVELDHPPVFLRPGVTADVILRANDKR